MRKLAPWKMGEEVLLPGVLLQRPGSSGRHTKIGGKCQRTVKEPLYSWINDE